MQKIVLSRQHIEALNRRRRVIVNLDTNWGLPGVEDHDAQDIIDFNMEFFMGLEGSQVDSIWWAWGEMNYGPWPSKILPVNHEYQKWLKRGVDPLRMGIEEGRKRGLEAFMTFRINGGEGYPAGYPVLDENPGWGFPEPVWQTRRFNFAIKEARDYKLSIIREVAENYDFDGIEIDWRCGPMNFPDLMRVWENREHLTEFMRSVRMMLLEVGKKKGKPILLAARVPENIEGCHYDGLDVEKWVEENLVDILALGCHNFEVDIKAFRLMTLGKEIKLYPSTDDHHPSSGYEHPPIEVFRGVFANFWNQGADGMYTFNFYPLPYEVPVPGLSHGLFPSSKIWAVHRQAYCEMGSPETLRFKDKVFVTQRRGGGQWAPVSEFFYANSNCFAQLPKELSNDKNDETYIHIPVGDDVNKYKDRIKSIELRVLLSDPEAAGLPADERICGGLVKITAEDVYFVKGESGLEPVEIRNLAEPPARGLENNLRTRMNGIILGRPAIRERPEPLKGIPE
ncbi:MAG: hypothetical protein CVU38_01705 [Chloroflexi bacterium HGW-Chloroflexi-1]|nr:MAG: hypothetical protein CVU38_01705 [Chloroflexi bacterium HGW-Chloroflexi-1]